MQDAPLSGKLKDVHLFAANTDAADRLLALEEAYQKALVEFEQASDSYLALLKDEPKRPNLIGIYREVTAKGDRARATYADFEALRRTLVASAS